jgi:hypothetical protein
VNVGIEIILGDLALGAKPNVFEALGVADAFFEDADDVRPAAYVRMDQGVD